MDKLWDTFCKTGKITDYLNYNRSKAKLEGDKINADDNNGSSDRGESLR